MNNNRNYRIMKFFEVADKSCNGKGYVKIDMRGNRGSITVNVENLSNEKIASEVYLFKNKAEKIKIGPINAKRGRLQRNIVLNGKDEAIENYNICGVVLNDKILMYAPVFNSPLVNQLNVLLSDFELDATIGGYSEKTIQCEDELIDDMKERTVEASYSNKQSSVENVNRRNNYTYFQNTNLNSSNLSTENDNARSDKFQNDIIQNIDIDNNKTAQIEEEYRETQNHQEENSRKFNNEYERKLFTLLNEFETIKPLQHKINNMSWWKIVYDENSIYKGFLPYFNQIITTYYPYPLSNHVTTCQSLMQRHGYYLFGVFEENGRISKYVYGVPGKFTRDEQPYRGVTGFKNWSYKSSEIPGDYGYWIAFIDANTGSVSEAPEVE